MEIPNDTNRPPPTVASEPAKCPSCWSVEEFRVESITTRPGDAKFSYVLQGCPNAEIDCTGYVKWTATGCGFNDVSGDQPIGHTGCTGILIQGQADDYGKLPLSGSIPFVDEKGATAPATRVDLAGSFSMELYLVKE